MEKTNQLKVGIILSYASKLIQLIIGFLYTPIMIRLLGQKDYGVYNLGLSIVAYLGVLNFGFGSAYMRFFSRYSVEENERDIANLNGMFIIIFLVLGLLAIIGGIIVILSLDTFFSKSLTLEEIHKVKIIIFILVFNLAFSFSSIVFNTYIQAKEQFVFLNIVQIIKQITTPLISIPILLSGRGSVGLVLATTIINIISELIIIYFARTRFFIKFSVGYFDKVLFKEMTVFSLFIFINLVVDQINNNVDKTILGYYKGSEAVAIYSIGLLLVNYFTQISTTISSVFIPRIHRMIAGENSIKKIDDLFIKIGRIQFILLSLVSLGFIFFGKNFIILWAGDNYKESYWVALILMVSITIPLIQNIGIEIQRAYNLHHFRSIVYLLIAILNILISIPLSSKYGSIGASIGTAMSYVLGNGIAMNWHYSNKVGLDIKQFWKSIFSLVPSFFFPVIFGIFIIKNDLLTNILSIVTYGILFLCIYSLSIWFLGLNDYEKKLIKNPFK